MGMTVLFSRRAEIAIKALLYLTTQEKEQCVDVRVIAKELQVPKMFAAKILQELVYKNIVNSKKGKNGGFFLPVKNQKITLLQIVEAIDGLGIFNQCIFGFPNCSDEHPCPVHSKWGTIRKDIYQMLNELSINDLKEETRNKLKSLKMI